VFHERRARWFGRNTEIVVADLNSLFQDLEGEGRVGELTKSWVIFPGPRNRIYIVRTTEQKRELIELKVNIFRVLFTNFLTELLEKPVQCWPVPKVSKWKNATENWSQY
jgi:hypothetical protein